MRACEWCGTMFTPTEPDHTYCKHVHAQKARKARNRAKQELAAVGRCPTPYKRVYVNEAHAEARHLPANQYLYPCACGAIHSATNRTGRTITRSIPANVTIDGELIEEMSN